MASKAMPPRQNALIVTPARRGSRAGNRVTALRWAGLLRRLGAHVRVREQWRGEACDLLIAVHAVKSAPSVLAAAAALPRLRVVVLLAGTDVYPTFVADPNTVAALERADALIALQPHAGDALPPLLRAKVRTIVQSATPCPAPRASSPFRICVLAHLRPVKDALLAVRALASVQPDPPVELLLAGKALTPELATTAANLPAVEPRARWLGELPRRAARELLASSHLCIVPSVAEGGANVVSEAIAAGCPILATAIPGNVGLLGDDWPGLFPVGDAERLGALIRRAAADRDFHHELVRRTLALQPLVDPRREMAAWRQLLDDLETSRR